MRRPLKRPSGLAMGLARTKRKLSDLRKNASPPAAAWLDRLFQDAATQAPDASIPTARRVNAITLLGRGEFEGGPGDSAPCSTRISRSTSRERRFGPLAGFDRPEVAGPLARPLEGVHAAAPERGGRLLARAPDLDRPIAHRREGGSRPGRADSAGPPALLLKDTDPAILKQRAGRARLRGSRPTDRGDRQVQVGARPSRRPNKGSIRIPNVNVSPATSSASAGTRSGRTSRGPQADAGRDPGQYPRPEPRSLSRVLGVQCGPRRRPGRDRTRRLGNPSGVTLRAREGVEQTILRRNVEEIASTGKSLMPRGPRKTVSPAEMADLISFLLRIQD